MTSGRGIQRAKANAAIPEVPKLIEETPLPYLTPLSREMIKALQSVGEVKLVDLALWEECQ